MQSDDKIIWLYQRMRENMLNWAFFITNLLNTLRENGRFVYNKEKMHLLLKKYEFFVHYFRIEIIR